eukprot:jgi/Psemu1/328156/estExt_fgenesh1_pg.C_10400004
MMSQLTSGGRKKASRHSMFLLKCLVAIVFSSLIRVGMMTTGPMVSIYGSMLYQQYDPPSNQTTNITNIANEFSSSRELFGECRSPEKDVPWPFGPIDKEKLHPGAVASIFNPHLQCGWGRSSHSSSIGATVSGKIGTTATTASFMDYFRDTVKGKMIQPILNRESCSDMVVFGAALGDTYVDYFLAEIHKTTNTSKKHSVVDPERLIEQHGKCFFLFVQSKTGIQPDANPLLAGHTWLVALDADMFPYQHSRRNAKLIKYMGHAAFLNDDHSESAVSPKHIVWQDAKFYRGGFILSVPRDYASVLKPWAAFDPRNHSSEQSQSKTQLDLPCLTAMGIPISMTAFSPPIVSEISTDVAISSYPRLRYLHHCETVIRALTERPDKQQTNEKDKTSNEENKTDGQPDSQSKASDVRSSNDELDKRDNHHSLPYPLQAVYSGGNGGQPQPVDHNWKPHAHDLDLVRQHYEPHLEGQQEVFVRITRSSCHWYLYEKSPNQPLGERLCGHKVWIKKIFETRYPSLDQERIIRQFLPSLPTGKGDDFREMPENTRPATNTDASLVVNDRNRDTIDQPFVPDFYQCSSPEFDTVPWPFGLESNANTITDNNSEERGWPSCGEPSPVHKSFWEAVWNNHLRYLANKDRCSDLVVFSEALGVNMEHLLRALEMTEFTIEGKQKVLDKQSKMQLKHGRCFFLFVLEEDLKAQMDGNHVFSKPLMVGNHTDVLISGQYLLIPVDRKTFPYKSMPRNSRLLRYGNQFLFPYAKTAIYQDVNFLSEDYSLRLPVNYHQLHPQGRRVLGAAHAPCLTVFSLPRNSQTVGKKSNVFPYDGLFEGHCKYLLNSFVKKGTEEGNSISESLIQQCDAYLQYVYKRELTTEILNHGMIDTNFMSWNEGTEYCRDFNAKLRCTILDQLHCHSHIDRIVFPFALYVQYQRGLLASPLKPPTISYKTDSSEKSRVPVGPLFDGTIRNLEFMQSEAPFGDANSTNAAQRNMILILRKRRHWTKVSIGPASNRS